MTKDGSRRSSVAASTQAPPQDSAASAPQTVTSDGDSRETSIANGTHKRVAEPPITTSDTTSLETSNGAIPSTGPAVIYGTRSRNRNGNARPNYAEDKEVDAEFETTPSSKEVNGRKGVRTAEATGVVEVGQSTASIQVVSGSELDCSTAAQNHQKETIPGTSSFAAHPPAAAHPSSKKRKAANSAASLQLPTQVPGHNPQQAVTRRASMVVPGVGTLEDSNMLSFENCAGRLRNNKLEADDGTILEVNDHAYLVCEPPGEAYYLGRIMEFLHVNNDETQPIDALRLNWYYRPKDIGRTVNDWRQVFASMHSDVSPLTALRGKCHIKHKSEVEKLDDLKKTKDCFWYEKLYDRYIHRYYDVIPTSQVINVPVEVKKVLDERWRFIVVEPGRGKELTSAVKTCKRCSKYCASNDSVDCAVCHNTYHMSCVSPPLLKKPSRGFAWACGPCSKAQEKKLEARNIPKLPDAVTLDGEEEENLEEEEEVPGLNGDATENGRASPTDTSEVETALHPGTAEQIHQASLWLFRYLGIHCNVEDALDYDDRIYPRASSRLGPRHQANVPAWPGRPVEYVKPTEIKRKYMKGGGHKKDTKLSKETLAAIEADKLAREKRPTWVMDEPVGYVRRGEDYDDNDPKSTAQLLYRLPETRELSGIVAKGSEPEELPIPAREQIVFDFMGRAAHLARPLGLPLLSTNLLDVALQTLRANAYDVEKALQVLSKTDRKVFKEPDPTPQELKKFEDGVAKYGSEWHSIKKHVKTMSAANIVRFYYTWKKTDRGKQVWGNYTGRKGKKEAKRAASVGKLQDDVADDNDDSAFDNEKARERKRSFQCKFCSTRESRQWRRAPNTPAGTMIYDGPAGGKASAKDKGNQYMVALCRRCAELWRRYAIQWEDPEEVKKASQAGGRAWKRKIDEELLKELVAANEVANQPVGAHLIAPISANGTPAPATTLAAGSEPPRKKLKGALDSDPMDSSMDTTAIVVPKKKVVPEKPVGPPPPPEPPKAKVLPCAICGEMDPMGDQHLSCKDCRMTVHRNCYGVVGETRSPGKWTCDMCSNDKNPQVSVSYECILCPVKQTEHDFVEPPKITHKKKSEKERERDRIDRESAQRVADYFRKKQEEMNKPLDPREPLKRTANNNWVHVTCAVFTPEVKFGNAKALEPSEGIPSIPTARYDDVCKLCKKSKGACVSCHSCKAPVHVECAHQAGYILGFDITPVKGSRRDQLNVVNIDGDIGTMSAAVWCKDHVPTKTVVHQMHDVVDVETGLNALQLYVQNFKQADLTLTGTVRKATLVNQSTKVVNPQVAAAPPPNRRSSTTTNGTGRGSISYSRSDDLPRDSSSTTTASVPKICVTCDIDVSPKWWPFPPEPTEEIAEASAVGISESNGDQALSSDPSLTNGHTVNGTQDENGGNNVALAAAALHRNPAKVVLAPTEFQCHQCHWKKILKEPSPPPPPPLAPAVRESPKPPPSVPTPVVPMPEMERAQPSQAPYPWAPPAPVYSVAGASYWPHRSPGSQGVPLVNQLNGNHSPRTNPEYIHALNGQAPMRQPVHNMPLSPHQSTHGPQIPNGYPPSPRHSMGSPAVHMQNGTYGPYASTRHPPQHLTNGGPPPRAPEHPYSYSSAPMNPRQSYGQPLGSPPILRDTHAQVRDAINLPNNARPSDGRVNGGASASPSLRNLLS